MRTNYHFLYSALFTMFIFTSCVNDDKNLSVPTPKQTSELNVPDNFDWSSTQGLGDVYKRQRLQQPLLLFI